MKTAIILITLFCTVQVYGTGSNCGNNNPCTQENIDAGNFYFAAEDALYFVQCDAHGGCFVMPCAPGTQWDQEHETCGHMDSQEEEADCIDGPVETDVVCQNRGWAFLSCAEGTTISVQSANYGRTESSRDVCRYYWFHRDSTDCLAPATEAQVRDRCDGEQYCAMPATDHFFGDTCPGTYKYLTVTYQCVCEEEPVPETFDCEENNPCTDDQIAESGYYFPHHDQTKFVQCDDHGGCFVMPCGPGTVWSNDAKTCVLA